MKKIFTFLITIGIPVFILFIVLFDTNGLGLGVQLFYPLISDNILNITNLLGNILWLISLMLYWIPALYLFSESINEQKIKLYVKNGKFDNFLVSNYLKIVIVFDVIVGFIAIGSTFIFTGIGMVIFIICLLAWKELLASMKVNYTIENNHLGS